MSKTKWGRLTWDSNTKNYFHFAGNGGFTGKYYGNGLNAGRRGIAPFSHIIYSDNNSTDKKNRYIANYDTDPTQLLYFIADSMPSNSIYIQNTFSINEDISLFFRYRVGGLM